MRDKLPDFNIVIKLTVCKSNHVANQGNPLRCQRWLARIMAAEHVENGEAGQSDDGGQDKEGCGIRNSEGHDADRRMLEGTGDEVDERVDDGLREGLTQSGNIRRKIPGLGKCVGPCKWPKFCDTSTCTALRCSSPAVGVGAFISLGHR